MDINFGWKGQAHHIVIKVDGPDKKRGSQSPCTFLFLKIDTRKRYTCKKKNEVARPHPYLVATRKGNQSRVRIFNNFIIL